MNWLEIELYDTAILNWLIASGIAVVLILLFSVLHRRMVARLDDRSHAEDARAYRLFADVLAHTPLVFLSIMSIYIGSQFLDLPSKPARILDRVFTAALLIQAALWGSRAISWWLTHTLNAKRATDAAGATSVAILGFIARVVLWSIVLLMILDNFGVDITTLVASLGIGGIAVALATQNILGDIFASLSITLDKPFVIGDFIIVGDVLGTVEYIGIKTTRIRSLFGEQIIFSNADLLGSRIRNYKRMVERRIVFKFGVIYETPTEQLEGIPATVRKLVEAQPKTRFDRAHFNEYGDSSLNFEVVYYVKDPDYNVYMDIQQNINIGLLRNFRQHGISFAYPTRTLYVQSDNGPTTAKNAEPAVNRQASS